MQAIARVNRVFRDKPGGLIVDYLGLADELKHAMAIYTESGGKGQPSYDTATAVAAMLEKYEVCCQLMHGFDWAAWTMGSPADRLRLLPPAQEHVLKLEDGKSRFTQAVVELSRAFALCAAHDEAKRIRDDVSFFPGPPGRAGQGDARRAVRRGTRPCRPPVGLEGDNGRGGHRGCLRGRRPEEARHLNPV
jgi:type I restriction enzyme R subunit